MNRIDTTSKPFTVPTDDAPDETYIRVYWSLVSREPRWLHGLKRADGTLYLERRMRRNTANYTHSLEPISLNNQHQKQAG
jgi:hypothetical protein